MKLIRNCVAAALAIVASAAVAHAGPISYSDTFDPTDQLFANVPASLASCIGTNGAGTDSISGQVNGACEVLTYTHVLTPPYIPLTDTLSSAILSIYVYDNNDQAAEKLDYSLDAGALAGDFPLVNLNGEIESSPLIHQINVLGLVTADGTLVVTLSRQAGDLKFKLSTLTAEGVREDEQLDINQESTVPEPTTLALLGLAAVASFGRKRFA